MAGNFLEWLYGLKWLKMSGMAEIGWKWLGMAKWL